MSGVSAPAATRRPAGARRSPAGVAAVLGSGGIALAGCAAVALGDPSVPGRYGLCPFYAVTGLWCPLCGSLRAVHHLTRGEVAAAAGSNLLLVLAVPVAVYAWLVWAARAFGRPAPPVPRLPAAAWWTLLAAAVALLAVFGVARNLAAYAWLAPEVVWTAR